MQHHLGVAHLFQRTGVGDIEAGLPIVGPGLCRAGGGGGGGQLRGRVRCVVRSRCLRLYVRGLIQIRTMSDGAWDRPVVRLLILLSEVSQDRCASRL